MLLGEPPRSGGDISFQLLGIPVRVHPFFWLIAVMLGVGKDTQMSDLLIWVVAVFISVLVHEMGHALTMRAYGIWPRVTLYGLGGLASYDPADARRVNSLGQVLISFAGPGSQFLLAAVLTAIVRAAGYKIVLVNLGPIYFFIPAAGEVIVSGGLTELIFNLIFVSVFWGVLNLIPVYPLDGGQISREPLSCSQPTKRITQSLQLSIVAAIAMVVVGVSLQSPFMAILFGFLGSAAIRCFRPIGISGVGRRNTTAVAADFRRRYCHRFLFQRRKATA